MNLYPVNLDICGRLCLIVGGGEVAARKIGPLVSCGARVNVVSPNAVPVIEKLADAGKITWHKRKYRRGEMDDAFLVFAATDNSTVQQEVQAEAAEKGILINSATDPVSCTFQVPARVRRGNFLLTVSTGGGSPALAVKLRKELETEYGKEYQQLVDLLAYIRKIIVADGQSSDSHKILFEKLLQLNILTQIRKEDWPALQEELQAVLPKEVDVGNLINSIRFPQKQ
ncbi:MAG: bifunctional precorrin-2 dehydrogenase/sirohydrochlorin ferrochelatase [Desulfopila sp.]|jgi:precorrin-2 dehydrogenase/sirohydrochlorin ferrochelatase|nr:bifunctional precorrin-2 dehydrogenase/sirohydrochlorin ferrochelatase [Desulfopila sp.]